MFQKNDRIAIRAVVSSFHYAETPHYSLASTLQKLQKLRVRGTVERVDAASHSVGVLFPKMRDLVWFKVYEVEKSR